MPEEIFSVFLTITYGLILVSIVVLVNSFERIIMDILWPLDMQFYSTKWNRVQELSSVEISSPLAIIYANSLLDDALKKREYPDETMCQRLESARSVFRNKKQVWNKNQIAHDVNMELLTVKEMKQALQGVSASIRWFGCIIS